MKFRNISALVTIAWMLGAMAPLHAQPSSQSGMAAALPATAASPQISGSPSPYFPAKSMTGRWEYQGYVGEKVELTIESDDGQGRATGKFTILASRNYNGRCVTVIDLPVDIQYNSLTGTGQIDNQPNTQCERHWKIRKTGPATYEGESLMGTEMKIHFGATNAP